MQPTPIVHGTCEIKYLGVKQQFEKNMRSGCELGAAISIVRHGELVVDLWSGYSDKKQTLPWEKDTIVNVFSTTKGITALCVQHALDSGLIDLDRPAQYYWPDFGKEGKQNITLRWMLSHQSGVAALREPVPDEALYDWDYMVKRVASERPWWKPGSEHGYHMVTVGWMVGEVFRRAVGCSVGEYLRDEVVAPLSADFHIGLGASEFSRVAQLRGATETPKDGRVFLFEKMAAEREGVLYKALMNPQTLMTSANKDEWRRMELPSANGHGNARSIAALYGAAVSGTLLSEAALSRCFETQSEGMDWVLEMPTRFGPGFLLQQEGHAEMSFGLGKRAFGHPGSGGSLGFADPDSGIGFGYVMNQMGPYVMVDPRARSLVDALYTCLAPD
ncbi:hypothetical protein A9Q99_19020 [Gammaproteobacteria bacterium 45_16_T64]|nr:hypothetical protein A9Q99_19020 [Gammaproteobacteria bacterium 45_16_T64]